MKQSITSMACNPLTVSTTIDAFSKLDQVIIATVGDLHIESKDTVASLNLAKVVAYLNTTDVDLVLFVGDIVDNATALASYTKANTILKNLKKQYYLAMGNHDAGGSECIDCGTGIITPTCNFTKYFATPPTQLFTLNGVQFILTATCWVGVSTNDPSWYFDFTKANLTMPTIVVNHGPVAPKPTSCTCCNWGTFFGYAFKNTKDIRVQLRNFSHLLGCFSGHVHYDTINSVNINAGYKTLCVTNGTLSDHATDGCKYLPQIYTKYLGYAKINSKTNQILYSQIDWTIPFKKPF